MSFRGAAGRPKLVRGLLWGAACAWLVGCGPTARGPSEPPPAVTAKPDAAPAPESAPELRLRPVDPVATATGVAGLKRLCDDHLALAAELVEQVRAVGDGPAQALTFDSTLGRLDLALWCISNGAEYAYLLGVVHPDDNVRAAARACESKADALTSSIWRDAALAHAIEAYAAARAARGTDAQPLSAERERFLQRAQRQFVRNGAFLGPRAHDRLRRLDEEMMALGQHFVAAINAAVSRIQVRPGDLAGLPEPFIRAHPADEHGWVTVTTEYPDYYPFVTYARNRQLAHELYVRFTNRGGEPNLRRLERLLVLRYDKAQLLGYPSWADFVIEPRMAGSVAEVRAFIDRLRRSIRPLVRQEQRRFRRMHLARGGDAAAPLIPPDQYYLVEQLRRKEHGFDSRELAAYFEIRAVTRGVLDLTARMYGLAFRPVRVRAWHRDVEAYEVRSGGTLRGRIYLDLHGRPYKYKHTAMFAIRHRRQLPDGSLQTPEAAMVGNFPAPGEPMSHRDVVTFFHEFGHLIHHTLAEAELAIFAGTNAVRDFVEVPSQVFEQWAWDREVLDGFARHRVHHGPIPDRLFEAMTRARRVGVALSAERQLFLAELDLAYHSRRPDFDTTQLLRDIQTRTSSFAFVPGTHFQSSFGHLVGYDAGYYSYPWAMALGWDAFGRFQQAGLMDRATIRAWRRLVLAPGGGLDERGMLRQFLGREPNEQAYVRFLSGK